MPQRVCGGGAWINIRSTHRRSEEIRGTFEAVLPYAEAAEAGALNKYSAVVTAPKSGGAGQAQLYATGMRPTDMQKPQARHVVLSRSAKLALARSRH